MPLPLAPVALLASIPSPGSGSLHLGSLQLRAYGLCIALGVLAAVWLASRRWVERGHSPDDFPAIALWGVPAGVIGARLYHVITDWHRFSDHPLDAFKIWEGGLGIWGGVVLGVAAGAFEARRRHLDVLAAMDAAAPGILLAQAIGRLGNWFNQELFGRPTDLPWGLEIDREHRPAQYLGSSTFQPTFLYELLWNLLVVAMLLWVDRHHRLKRGKLFVLYVAAYTFGRFFVERMRIDEATHVAGLRINEIVAAVVFLVAVGVLFAGGLKAAPGEEGVAPGADTDGGLADGLDEEPEGDGDEVEPSDGIDHSLDHLTLDERERLARGELLDDT